MTNLIWPTSIPPQQGSYSESPADRSQPAVAPFDGFAVALINMPFASVELPSIQVGLLKAAGENSGFKVDAFHFNLNLAAQLGLKRYESLCGHRGRMTGEWLFSIAAFESKAMLDDSGFVNEFPEEIEFLRNVAGVSSGDLRSLRYDLLPSFISQCLESAPWDRYQVVGFSSTFQQNVASLALARLLKQRFPHLVIVFGGANMEGVMGVECLRAFSFIDYVVAGEGDVAFPELLNRLANNQCADIAGIARRVGNDVVSREGRPVRDLNSLPLPQYEEFFDRARKLGIEPLPRLPFETSRGCWWGQKNHCTFCGLNGQAMAYRMKDAARVLSEIKELSRRYRVYGFDATDNIIAPKYIHSIFENLAEHKSDFEFFYEVKSNLTRHELHILHRGGLRRLQPGIESLSTHILTLMRKGATMLQNVRILKWCRYYGIRVNWNLLCGFPGEEVGDYRRQLDVLRLISHLEPPNALSRIWLERFSPYFVDRESYPIHDVKPEASYRYVYPLGVYLDKIAYFFEYAMNDVVADEELYPTEDWITEWRQRWSFGAPSDSLLFRHIPDVLIIYDSRGQSQAIRYLFDGPLGIAYEYCSETSRSIDDVIACLSERDSCRSYSRHEVQGALEEFCRAGLMVGEEGQYLSLALPINPHW